MPTALKPQPLLRKSGIDAENASEILTALKYGRIIKQTAKSRSEQAAQWLAKLLQMETEED